MFRIAMPTAARLFAAFGLAMVGYFTAEIYKPHAPEGTQFGAFSTVSAVLGLIFGWRSIGPEIGRGYKVSGNVGLRGAIILLVAALLVFSFEHMLVLALRRTYDGPMEALVDIVSIAIDYLQQIMLP
ncbi:MAG: TrgA family protein, partial [Paracoccaceae bacterium]